MFHVELRQFPHVARAFNLTAAELHARLLAGWVSGQTIELEDRRWQPGRAKLTIYEARALAADELGMGRGWGTVSREGENVTERLLEAVSPDDGLAEIKQRLLGEAGPLTLSRVVELTSARGRRASERLAVAEQAVWELLHEGRLRMLKDGGPVAPERWQPLLLDWTAWSTDTVRVEANG